MIIKIFDQNFIVNKDNLIIYFNDTIFNLINMYDDELQVKLNYIKINIYNKHINRLYNCARYLSRIRDTNMSKIKNICPHNVLYEDREDDYHRVYYEYYCKLCDRQINKKEEYDSKAIKKKYDYTEIVYIKRRKVNK